jgi:hypothetical protein
MVRKSPQFSVIIFLALSVAVCWAGSVVAANISATITPGIFAPTAPLNLAATVEDRSIVLSWSSPSSNGGSTIIDYIVEYKLASGGTWSTFSDGVSTNTTATVSSLSNDTAYDFRVSAENAIGQGPSSSEVSVTPGPSAQVLIVSMSDTTVPGITAAVRITNEGGVAYEYQYTWCVTDSDSNLCGGGNDVFSSSAAKLIQQGEDWDTNLNATVSTAGNYWFHLDVEFGSDSSHASQSFTATEVASSGSGDSGGGGGGGGSGSSPASVSREECTGADVNDDNRVSSVDFSIMLTFWKRPPPSGNVCVDLTGDNVIDSVDFSILLYQWGKLPTPLI